MLREALATLRGKRPRRRGYAAGQISRLTNTWTTDPGSINRTLRYELRTLRARARQLTQSEGYAAKFVSSCETNIAGPVPFRLQAKIRRPRGTLDSRANRVLEQAWGEWTTTECDAAGRMTLGAIHRLVVRTLARDGEALIRLRQGEGKHGLRIQVLDVDRLDEERNESLPGGNVIKMGVEVNPSGRAVAYHLLREHPGELGQWGTMGVRETVRVDAEDIIHVFVPTNPEQVRGAPWLAPVMFRLWNVSGFEEAAVISARTGATKMGFYVSPDGSLPPVADGTDPSGRFVQDAEPGTFEVLPIGYDFKSWDPPFPEQAIEPFIRQTLRGIAAGLGVAYHSLANDPSNVNYSTARVALLEERDMWSAAQSWYVEHVCQRILAAWITAAIMRGVLPLEFTDPRYQTVWWKCKTWDWVDPLKDTQAEIAALGAMLTSRTRIAAERGQDIEDIFDELAAEHALAAEKGIELTAGTDPAAGPKETEDDGNQEQNDTPARALRVVG
jgi:lambda family phage portal protein